jgi:peptidoglycan/LPS O-acetylase OafA/YrhL
MKSDRKRNLQLDVLRGLAILLVFGRHVELPYPDGPIGALGQVWFRIGWLGVDLFFVLSGFLIGGLLLSEVVRHGRIDVPRFLIRRGFKLYPGYLVFIAYLLLMPVAKAIAAGRDAGAVLAEGWTHYWPNLLFLQNYVATPAGHTWSLAVEEHFYFLLPFALAALAWAGRLRLLAPACVAMVPLFIGLRAVSLWSDDAFAETMSATHLRLDALLFGVGIRALAQFSPERFEALRRWRGPLLAAGVLLWLPHYFGDPASPWIRTLGLTSTYLGSAAFLIAAYHTRAHDLGWLRPAMAPVAAVLAWVGVYSYAIYLWHITTFGFVSRLLGSAGLSGDAGISPFAWVLSASVMSAGAVVIGAAATFVVEWPVLNVRDRLFPSRSGSLPSVDATVPESAVPVSALGMALPAPDQMNTLAVDGVIRSN